ncbi:hypothetical protein ACHWQZ_G013503 [Mnemiopsis leidyi]
MTTTDLRASYSDYDPQNDLDFIMAAIASVDGNDGSTGTPVKVTDGQIPLTSTAACDNFSTVTPPAKTDFCVDLGQVYDDSVPASETVTTPLSSDLNILDVTTSGGLLDSTASTKTIQNDGFKTQSLVVVGKKRLSEADSPRASKRVKRPYTKTKFEYFPERAKRNGPGGDKFYSLMEQFVSKRIMFRVLDTDELDLLFQTLKIPRKPVSIAEAQKKFVERWRASKRKK